MSSEPLSIKADAISKCYQIYAQPTDRLKQFIVPRIKRKFGYQSNNYFTEFWALQNISLEIKRGQTVGIIGRNGSGKSTLLQILCGTLYPTLGDVRVNGRVAALLELGSGFNPEFTGKENIFFNAGVLGQAENITRERLASIEAFADIGDFIEQPVKTYSSGMLVRLAFAVIAHVDADILIIDEALAVGDVFFTQKCMRFLRSFMAKGTVLFVSHDTNSVKNLCDHVIWLEKGKLRQQGDPKTVCESYLKELYAQQEQEIDTSSIEKTPNDNSQTNVPIEYGDQRLPYLNTSNLRNDLQVFQINIPEAESFGAGGAKISQVNLTDLHGNPLAWVVGGEPIRLRITAEVFNHLDSPIIGFIVKDHLGQVLFGDNTYLSYQQSPIIGEPGKKLIAEFSFFMPRMMPGDYTITATIADGSQQEHIQHHWVFDALAFRSECTSASAGLLGIPMQEITLTTN